MRRSTLLLARAAATLICAAVPLALAAQTPRPAKTPRAEKTPRPARVWSDDMVPLDAWPAEPALAPMPADVLPFKLLAPSAELSWKTPPADLAPLWATPAAPMLDVQPMAWPDKPLLPPTPEAPMVWATPATPPVMALAPKAWVAPDVISPFPGLAPESRFRTSPPPGWASDDPADSLYRQARDLLNRGDYRRASQLFRDLAQKYPRSEYAPDALYWDAFARYRIGSSDELRLALNSLDQQRKSFPQAKTQADASALATRIRGALAARGDQQAAASLERDASGATGAPCDQEEQAVRSEALSALSQADPSSVAPMLRKVLAKKDECSAPLRRRAVFLIGQRGDSSAAETLIDVAKNDPDGDVRVEATLWLSKVPGDRGLAGIEELLRTSSDERVQRAAIRAAASHPSPRARTLVRALIERADASERLRAEAIGTYERERTSPDDVAFLRALYPKLQSDRLRERVVSTIARVGGPENAQWLMSLARNAEEPMELRASALRWTAQSTVAIGDAVKLYDAVSERPLREQLIEVYAYRKEPEATDKLLDIVKSGTDPQLRRRAINALSRKNDPRTTKLLMEIIGQ